MSLLKSQHQQVNLICNDNETMFIVKFKDGTSLNGKDCLKNWDDVPKGKEITALQLSLPFKAHIKTDKGFEELPSRTITLTGYNRYFYSKEAHPVKIKVRTL